MPLMNNESPIKYSESFFKSNEKSIEASPSNVFG